MHSGGMFMHILLKYGFMFYVFMFCDIDKKKQVATLRIKKNFRQKKKNEKKVRKATCKGDCWIFQGFRAFVVKIFCNGYRRCCDFWWVVVIKNIKHGWQASVQTNTFICADIYLCCSVRFISSLLWDDMGR